MSDEASRTVTTHMWPGKHGPCPVLFMGDAHCVHLKVISQNFNLISLKNRGVKWWTIEDNLNGEGLSPSKHVQYGDRWSKFEDENPAVSYMVVVCVPP